MVMSFQVGNYKGKVIGTQTVTAEWTAEKLAASEASRQREKALTIANEGVDRALQADKSRRAAVAVLNAGKLRKK